MQGQLTQPFNLSLHPFAMLTAPQAAKHALQHCKYIKLLQMPCDILEDNARFNIFLEGQNIEND